MSFLSICYSSNELVTVALLYLEQIQDCTAQPYSSLIFIFYLIFSAYENITFFTFFDHHSVFYLFFILFSVTLHYFFFRISFTFSSAYESALDSLPRPTVILCKSARRAGAVLNAYVVRSLIYRVVLFCGAIYRIFEFYD